MGRWETVYETQDESEWRAHIHHLRATDRSIDWTVARLDTFCGRLKQPTTYRLSLFVANQTSDHVETAPES
ncbi:hypothetical protein [Kitasatospora sp. NBC_01302]|uniref:hypothetical protein n=1 Tax=Kitasatospora sp. NBC_01302 TaxID=2903575 RepID=UPI002E10ACEC|nr:hypothetical protein OG294_40605 [Kitasatospora sp. NBC_01302]